MFQSRTYVTSRRLLQGRIYATERERSGSEGAGMCVDVAGENSDLYPKLVRGHEDVTRSPEIS